MTPRASAHPTHHQRRHVFKWGAGVLSAVVAAVVINFLVSISSTVIETKRLQAVNAVQTQEQIKALSSRVSDLHEQVDHMPSKLSRVEARQEIVLDILHDLQNDNKPRHKGKETTNGQR